MRTFADTPVLENRLVRLEPLALSHLAELRAAVAEGELWRTWYTRIPSPEEMPDEIRLRLARHAAGEIAPWAVVDRLGAKQDGVLRNHVVWTDGTLRDTVVFSIIDSEWPTVRTALTHRIRRR